MRLRGLRDIKTHGSLAREERLIGVARNLHKMGNCEGRDRNISDDWSVQQYICPKKKLAEPRVAATIHPHREFFLENKVRLHQIEVIQGFLQEMRQAIAEGIPVATHEFNRLTKSLAEWKAE